MVEVFLSCLALGAVAGFLAGLFGIGGGLIIVPVLVYLLPKVGVPHDLLMSMALGTSFSTIVVTTFSAAQRHNKLGNVDWSVVRYFVPSLMIAVFLAGLVVSDLPKEIMSKIFAIMVLFLATKMLLSLKPKTHTKPLTTKSIVIAGGIIGVLSSFAGIAGGAFIVPFLNGRGVELKRAIGTSSFCGCLLGIAATISFIVSGFNNPNLPDYSIGYIYLPALLGIILSSFFTSKLGANAANVLPVPILKKAFAVMLMLIAMNMFFK
ncbi:sulfite exporter TauE/SafE family protein [Glaesserella sp.]|uniref:sulfite exporter TauE/SafE family protein n=1 Tax=Glaesserella sp. TaxID=2094731 RepID=UPI0035A08006